MSKKETDRFLPNDILEGMTSISALLNAPPQARNDRRILELLVDKDKVKSKERELAYLKHRSDELGFPIKLVASDDIAELTVGNTHGGIIALCSERNLIEFDKNLICDHGFYVMLDGIEDPYNFGYTLRSMYAAGADGIILPPRNWMGAAGTVARSSAGASEKLPIFTGELEDVIDGFKGISYKIAVAGIRDSVSIYDADLKTPLLLIVGGEKRGISRKLMNKSDLTVRIDYSKNSAFGGSLSAASAATVIAFEILRQNRDQ
jgi:23S rRNA (guanosine2251-2'-O)-methyltransferase